MSLFEFIALVVALVAIGLAIQSDSNKKKRAKLKGLISAQADFRVTHALVGADLRTGIAIDDGGRKVCLAALPDTARVYRFEDVLSCELFEDGRSISKAVRSSQALGAIIGGLALGGVGVVAGGLSGARKTVDTVTRIDLRLVVNDLQSPMHDVRLLDAEAKRGGFVHRSVSDKARFWAGLFEVIIEGSRGAAAQAQARGRPRPADVAGQLRELAKLRDDGILTEEEFAAQKAKLLA